LKLEIRDKGGRYPRLPLLREGAMNKDELIKYINGMPDDMELAYDHPEGAWAQFLTVGELKAILIPGYVPKPKPVYEQADCGFPF
jgi:hypothetical protein